MGPTQISPIVSIMSLTGPGVNLGSRVAFSCYGSLAFFNTEEFLSCLVIFHDLDSFEKPKIITFETVPHLWVFV